MKTLREPKEENTFNMLQFLKAGRLFSGFVFVTGQYVKSLIQLCF